MQLTIYMYVSNGYCVVITSLFPQCYTTVTMLSEAVILKTTIMIIATMLELYITNLLPCPCNIFLNLLNNNIYAGYLQLNVGKCTMLPHYYNVIM